jgi:predicted dehydrogenase
MPSDTLRVALIGYRFMGKLHSYAYHAVNHLMNPPFKVDMAVLCGRDAGNVARAASEWGWREWSTDWEAVVARPDIDAVDIAVPSDVHPVMAEAALRHGKHVLCEKPLANTVDEARRMVAAAEASRRVAMVGFNYRRAPAIQLAKQLLESGRLGRIYQVRGQYLQDWGIDPQVPLTWRFQQAVAGSGALGDLLTHVIDLTRFLVGEFEAVSAVQNRFIARRPLPGQLSGAGLGHAGETGSQDGPVTVDDVTAVLARLSGGVTGVFEATRFATGYKNALRLEIHGERGALRFDLERVNELEFYEVDPADPTTQGYRRILCTHPNHPYLQYWWPEGHTVGYDVTFAHEVYDWVSAIATGNPVRPDFHDGLRCQVVVAAIAEAAETGRTVGVSSD